MVGIGNQRQRLPEMDVMKGILTIMVILGHIVYIEGLVCEVQLEGHAVACQSIIAGVWIAPYYMAAFFFVTGFCSSFSADLRTQIVSDGKHLLIPAILIPFIMSALEVLLGIDIEWSYKVPWFLWSLFWAKIIFRLFRQYVNSDVVALLLMAVMSIIGSVMMYYIPDANYLGYQQALVFPLFLALGYKVKHYGLKPWILYFAGAVYVLSVSISFYFLGWGAPSLCAITTFSPEKWPIYFLLATSGTLGILQISRLLNKSIFLQYIGRHSLEFYLVHMSFLIFVTSYLRSQILQNYGNSTFQHIYYVLMFIGALLWSYLWSWAFNLRYLKWVLGKW